MAVRFYDEALVEKIKGWVKDADMKILRPDEVARLFQIKADLSEDKALKMPLISISRESSISAQNGSWSKKPMTFDGYMMEATEKSTKQLNAIGIIVRYQIDVFTKKYEEGDEYFRNLLFNLVNYPELTITIPYNNSNFTHVAHIKVISPAQDNSDIPQRLFPGEFTRWTITLEIDDAYLFSVPVVNNVKVSGIVLETSAIDGTELEEEDIGLEDIEEENIHNDN